MVVVAAAAVGVASGAGNALADHRLGFAAAPVAETMDEDGLPAVCEPGDTRSDSLQAAIGALVQRMERIRSPRHQRVPALSITTCSNVP